MDVRLSMTLPVIEATEPVDRKHRLVSLGIFSKTRLPELRVSASDGSLVTVLGRDARARFLAGIISERYLAPVRDASKSDIAFDCAVLEQGFRFFVEQIIKLNPDLARLHLDLLIRFLKDGDVLPQGYADLVPLDDLEISLAQVCSTTQLIGIVDAELGSQIDLSLTYIGRLAPSSDESDRSNINQAVGLLGHHALRVLTSLGLTAQLFQRTAHNVNHSSSYYLVIPDPSGAEVRRAYWGAVSDVYRSNLVRLGASDESLKAAATAAAGERVAASGQCLSSYADYRVGLRYTAVEIGLARSATFSMVSVISTLAAVGIMFVADHPGQFTGRPDGIALVAFIPALMLGAAERGLGSFAKGLAPLLLRLLPVTAGVVGVSGLFLAFEQTDVRSLGWQFRALLSMSAALTSFVGMVAGWIAFGPRFRIADRPSCVSRSEVRGLQLRDRGSALAFLMVAAIMTVIAGWATWQLSHQTAVPGVALAAALP